MTINYIQIKTTVNRVGWQPDGIAMSRQAAFDLEAKDDFFPLTSVIIHVFRFMIYCYKRQAAMEMRMDTMYRDKDRII